VHLFRDPSKEERGGLKKPHTVFVSHLQRHDGIPSNNSVDALTFRSMTEDLVGAVCESQV
jgi:hypothetical protein